MQNNNIIYNPNQQPLPISQFSQNELELIEKLDVLGTYSYKYHVGQWPTLFTCTKCGQVKSLKDMKYDPYTNTHYYIHC